MLTRKPGELVPAGRKARLAYSTRTMHGMTRRGKTQLRRKRRCRVRAIVTSVLRILDVDHLRCIHPTKGGFSSQAASLGDADPEPRPDARFGEVATRSANSFDLSSRDLSSKEDLKNLRGRTSGPACTGSACTEIDNRTVG